MKTSVCINCICVLSAALVQFGQKTQPNEHLSTKIVSLTRKVMAIVFWVSHGIVFIDYLDKSKTIIGLYYVVT